jgi:hypothetical protein
MKLFLVLSGIFMAPFIVGLCLFKLRLIKSESKVMIIVAILLMAAIFAIMTVPGYYNLS